MPQTGSRSFLKWAGGKFRLIEKLTPHLQGRKLIEPFVGSGAVFLNIQFERYLLGDINPDLIELYQILKQEKQSFISYTKTLFCNDNNNQETFLAYRKEFNQGATGKRRAALFIYLNRHGFNGLCRYNQSGQFNVPFGKYKKIYFPEKEFNYFLTRIKKAQFVCGDFVAVMNRSRKGDVVYCDPPYVPLSPTASFSSYAAQGFSYDQQVELAFKAKHLANRGVKVVISNHDNEITRKIYEDASIESFPVRRSISCDGKKRGDAKELMSGV